jgi:Uma2 family endonuclease
MVRIHKIRKAGRVMDNFLFSATSIRHNDIVTELSDSTKILRKKKEIRTLMESCALVYWGESRDSQVSLINIEDIEDVEKFQSSGMDKLNFVQPDYVVFRKDNLYLINNNNNRIAGRPNLIIEIWSDGNTKNDRAFLHYLYSTSPATEHWYIEQDNNIVECYLGKSKLSNQNMQNILKTQDGLEFDLRDAAIK